MNLELDEDKIFYNIDRYGNTSSVSIPLLIVTELIDKKIRNRALCTGYGAGLSWGNALINLNDTKILELVEYE